MDIKSTFTSNRQFEISSDLYDLNNNLVNVDEGDFWVLKLNSNLYRFLNKISLGVANVKAPFSLTASGFLPNINTFAEFEVMDEKTINVKLFTNIRWDLVIIGIISLAVEFILLFLQFFRGKPIPILINLICLIPFPLFSFIYKDQEKVLQEKVEKYIKVITGNW